MDISSSATFWMQRKADSDLLHLYQQLHWQESSIKRFTFDVRLGGVARAAPSINRVPLPSNCPPVVRRLRMEKQYLDAEVEMSVALPGPEPDPTRSRARHASCDRDCCRDLRTGTGPDPLVTSASASQSRCRVASDALVAD
jgi:hypothetical protein